MAAKGQKRVDRLKGATSLLAFLLMLVASVLIYLNAEVFQRCLGHPMQGGHAGRSTGLVELAGVFFCSPFLLSGTAYQIVLFVLFWGSMPLVVLGFVWNRQNEEKRAARRERDRQRRAEKHAAKRP